MTVLSATLAGLLTIDEVAVAIPFSADAEVQAALDATGEQSLRGAARRVATDTAAAHNVNPEVLYESVLAYGQQVLGWTGRR